MSTKSELLKLLESHRGEYLSGEELALRLGYSRTAVWKAMKSLRQEGYRITAVNNRGYALETDNDILSVEAVKMHLDNRDVFMEVEKEINSTNQYLKKTRNRGESSPRFFCGGRSPDRGKRQAWAQFLLTGGQRPLSKCAPAPKEDCAGESDADGSGGSGCLPCRGGGLRGIFGD